MSEYVGQTDPLGGYLDQVNHLRSFTDAVHGDPNALQRYQGAIWPANNPVGTEYTQGMGNQSGPFVPAPWGRIDTGRIDTAEHIMSLPGADLATGFVLGVDGGGNPLKVYHGTPHTFSPTEGNPLGAFDPTRIGSGEGAQAYGHGAAYVAEREATARQYRDNLTPSMSPENRETYLAASNAHRSASKELDDLENLMVFHSRNKGAVEAPGQEGWGDYSVPIHPDVQKFYQPKIDAMEAKKAQAAAEITRLEAIPPPQGRMYEAEFHASPDELLDWDKPLSQQSPKVQQALEGLGIKAPEIGTRQLDNGKWVVDYADEAGKPKTSSRQFADKDTAELYGNETMKMMGRDPEGQKIYRDMLPKVTYSVREAPDRPWGPSGVDTHDQALALVGGDKSRVLTVHRADDAHASQSLRDAGLKGIRYRDAGSRSAGDNPTHNYVVFDPSTLNIVRRYGIGALIGGGGAAAAAGAGQQP